MDKNYPLDKMIKIALNRKAQEVQVPKNLFSKINLELGGQANEPSNTTHKTGRPIPWRPVVEGCAVLLICGILFLAFSKEARVMAAEVVNSIKKVFVVEKVYDNYQVIEKPFAEFRMSNGLSQITALTDQELSQKIGYGVCFPTSLANGFELDFKVLGVRFDKIDINIFQKLNDRILRAIDDNQELKNLKNYQAQRYTGAFYKNTRKTIGIYILEKSDHTSQWTAQKVSFGNQHQGLWYEYPDPSYYEKNTIPNPKIRIKHALYLELDGLGYHFRPEGESDFTVNEVMKIAESYLKRINQ